ncbi:TlpA family protein disulfide reductase [Marinobacterium arenosum]|uniref:TlpA family protein disulfide reductase n=1 Tax=Marinobacterium arenosum TaxID=2862496 RepID=UPI001C96636D|nr:TlpA disulfide reductase family protein [Marinobacterium arenosum]MBY4677751.1 TlpA family protein disulfide reductase [Marinobacterium arenosum]
MRYAKPLTGALLALALAGPVTAASIGVNDQAPQIVAEQIDGQPFDLSQHRGKRPVYLKFWATWCSYCVEEMPHLQASMRKYGDRLAVQTVNVGFNDSQANIRQLYQKNQLDIPVIFDSKGEITARYGVIGTPTHLLIDRNGVVRYSSHLLTDQLEETLAALVAEEG